MTENRIAERIVAHALQPIRLVRRPTAPTHTPVLRTTPQPFRLRRAFARAFPAHRPRRAPGLLFALLLTLLSALLPAPLAAQQSAGAQWRLYQRGDGLFDNDIHSILIDGSVIWLGASAGVARFDGAWSAFPNAEVDGENGAFTSGMPAGSVEALARSGAPGVIWAGTDQGYLARWDGVEWAQVAAFDQEIADLAEINGVLYVALSDGLLALDVAAGDATPVAEFAGVAANALLQAQDRLWVGTDRGVWQQEGGVWTKMLPPDGWQTKEITALWVDPNRRVWVGTPLGVGWYEPATGEWASSLLPIRNSRDEPSYIRALTGDASGAVWAGSNGGGARKLIESGAITLDVSRSSGGGLTTPLVRDIAIDGDGAIWFATPVGLFQYLERSWVNHVIRQEGRSRSLNYINDLLLDRSGALWVAAVSGLRRKDPDPLVGAEVIFTTETGDLPAPGVLALAEDQEGAIWAGTVQGPARYLDGIWSRPVDVEGLPSPAVNSLKAWNGALWIGGDAGLAQAAPDGSSVRQVSELAGATVVALAVDGRGRLWAGTTGDGVWILSADGEWHQEVYDPDRPDSLPGSGVTSGGLVVDPLSEGGMWAVVEGAGLAYFDGERWENWMPRSRLPSSLIYRIYTDPQDGSLWVGVEGGVSHFDGRTWGAFGVEDGLQSSAVFAIAGTADKGYWFGGDEGLTYYWPERTPPWVRITSIAGAGVREGGAAAQAVQGQPVRINLLAGDLHTAPEDLHIFYRRENSPDWRELSTLYLEGPFSQLGEHEVQFIARDQAFNYSDIVTQRFEVVPAPALVELPYLGEVEIGIFWTLVTLGGVALLGFGYVSFEIVQQRRRTAEAVARGFNPFVSGEPVRSEDMFFGRHELLQRIVNTLHNNSIMIHGERRIGKTTILYQLGNVLREVDDPDYWFVPIYIDLEGTTRDEFFHFLMEEVAMHAAQLPQAEDELAPTLGTLRYGERPAAEYGDRDFSADLRQLIQALQAYGERHHPRKALRLILLMDEMDVVSNFGHLIQQQLRRIFMRDFAATLGAVVAGIQISKEWDRVESPWYNLFNEVEVEPFSREQALELLIEPVRDVYSYDPAALEFIIEHSEGRPFRLQQYALEAVSSMLADGRRRILLSDVESAHARIQDGHLRNQADSAGLQSKNGPPPAAEPAVRPPSAASDARTESRG